jgi:hypothetical protein
LLINTPHKTTNQRSFLLSWFKSKHSDMDSNATFWKSKAVRRNAENKELKKRIEEIKAGREKWKSKYMMRSNEASRYRLEIDSIKKKIKEILSE